MRHHGPALVVAVAVAATAAAHTAHYHKTIQMVARPDGLSAMVTLDHPRGKRALALRAAADVNGDKVLDADERQRLKAPLVRLALARLEVRRDGEVLSPRVADAKIDVRGSFAVDESPLSVAAMVDWTGGGDGIEIRDQTPDGEPVHVRIAWEPAVREPVEGMAAGALPFKAP